RLHLAHYAPEQIALEADLGPGAHGPDEVPDRVVGERLRRSVGVLPRDELPPEIVREHDPLASAALDADGPALRVVPVAEAPLVERDLAHQHPARVVLEGVNLAFLVLDVEELALAVKAVLDDVALGVLARAELVVAAPDELRRRAVGPDGAHDVPL